jgi:hypothetical protein
MKKKRKFQEGGNVVEPGDGVQYFADDELAAANKRNLRKEIDELNAAQYTGSAPIIDEYSGKETTTRRNLETGDYYSTEPVTRKAAPVRAAAQAKPKTPPPVSDKYREEGFNRPRVGSTQAAAIPTEQSVKAPKSTGESTSGMSNLDKLMAGVPAGMGATRFLQAGARGLANVMRTRSALDKAARENQKQIGEGRRMIESPGAFKRRDVEAKREERAARRDKEVSRGIRQKSDDSGAIRLAKGGSASSRADGCAVRGKTKGKVY